MFGKRLSRALAVTTVASLAMTAAAFAQDNLFADGDEASGIQAVALGDVCPSGSITPADDNVSLWLRAQNRSAPPFFVNDEDVALSATTVPGNLTATATSIDLPTNWETVGANTLSETATAKISVTDAGTTEGARSATVVYTASGDGVTQVHPIRTTGTISRTVDVFVTWFVLDNEDAACAPAPANAQPLIISDNTSVTVDEGSEATMTGTWSDANAADTVTLTASVGTVSKAGSNAAGTWSWSYTPSDGPDDSQTVTIYADDGTGSANATNSATFALNVNNVAPTIDSFDFTSSVVGCGADNASVAFTFSDPGVDTHTAAIDWGDGLGDQSLGTVTSPGGASTTYGSGGPYTATLAVTDSDSDDSDAIDTTNSLFVGYQSSGILQPINLGSQRSLFKFGSVIPVKLQVQDCDGNLVSGLTLRLRVQQLSSGTPSGVDEGFVSAGSANVGNLFRFDADAQQYIYNLSTKTLTTDPTSAWRLFVDTLLSAAPEVWQTGLTTADFGLKK